MDFKFPDVGEGITEGKLVHWKVKVGDTIKVDDVICEVETDKAVVDIPSPFSGTVSELLYKEGDTLNVGEVILKVGESGENNVEVSEEQKEENKLEKEKPVEEKVQEKQEVEKEKTKQESNLNDVSQLKSSNDVKAMPGVRKLAREKGIDILSVTPSGNSGQVTIQDLEGGKVLEAKEEKPVEVEEHLSNQQVSEEKENVKEQVSSKTVVASKDILATPSVRKKARELGIDINSIKGSGEGGRILLEDLESGNQISDNEDNSSPSADQSSEMINGDRISFTGIRGVIAKRMVESLQKSAQVTFSDEANLSKLVNLRNEEKEKLKDRGVKLTYLPFFMKAYVSVSKEFRSFNATVDDEKNEVVLHSDYNCGIAVDTKRGLVVAVVRDVDKKSIVELAKEIIDLSTRAQEGKLSNEEMSGSTFTISSVGNLGGGVFTPIINYPEVAILGIGKISKKPIVVGEEIKVGDMCTFSLTFDHRVVDGADAARFMKKFFELVEDPELLLMESS